MLICSKYHRDNEGGIFTIFKSAGSMGRFTHGHLDMGNSRRKREKIIKQKHSIPLPHPLKTSFLYFLLLVLDEILKINFLINLIKILYMYVNNLAHGKSILLKLLVFKQSFFFYRKKQSLKQPYLFN
jgi:hypothetical protein